MHQARLSPSVVLVLFVWRMLRRQRTPELDRAVGQPLAVAVDTLDDQRSPAVWQTRWRLAWWPRVARLAVLITLEINRGYRCVRPCPVLERSRLSDGHGYGSFHRHHELLHRFCFTRNRRCRTIENQWSGQYARPVITTP